jgi:enterochelin esterase-like enzyme
MKAMKTALTIFAAACIVMFVAPESKGQKGDEAKKDSPDRDVFVYLPPSYATSPNRRYPVVYFLDGYAAHAETWWKSLSVPAAADAAIADGSAKEMLLVLPDAFTVYDGSMFSNSPTTGDWETFVAKDLIAYIDGHYWSIAERGARGLVGHSMGAYGTVGAEHIEPAAVFRSSH